MSGTDQEVVCPQCKTTEFPKYLFLSSRTVKCRECNVRLISNNFYFILPLHISIIIAMFAGGRLFNSDIFILKFISISGLFTLMFFTGFISIKTTKNLRVK